MKLNHWDEISLFALRTLRKTRFDYFTTRTKRNIRAQHGDISMNARKYVHILCYFLYSTRRDKKWNSPAITMDSNGTTIKVTIDPSEIECEQSSFQIRESKRCSLSRCIVSQSAQRGHVNARYATRGANRGEGRGRGEAGSRGRFSMNGNRPRQWLTVVIIIASLDSKIRSCSRRWNFISTRSKRIQALINFYSISKRMRLNEQLTISFFLEKLLEIIDTRKDVESIF